MRDRGMGMGMAPIRGGVPRECYHLKDDFLGSDGPPLQPIRFCYPGPGTLTLDQTDGTFSIVVGGNFFWPVQGTPAWGDQEWYALNQNGDPFARYLGRVLKWRWAFGIDAEAWAGWNDDITPSTRALAEHPVYQNVGGAGIRCLSGGSDDQALYDLAPAAGWWQAAVALSPYDNAGLHWYPGKAGALTHGAHFFFRDEAGDDSWRLAWYRQLENTDPLYPAFSNLDSSGAMDFVYDPCATFEDELFTPIAWDEFTDNNGVLLPNHTMTYGGLTWVNAVGVWQITGNQADPDNTVNAHAYNATLSPDVWIEAIATPNTDDRLIGILGRKSVDTAGGRNLWVFLIRSGVAGNDTTLYELLDGVATVRANADIDYVAGTPHNLRVRLDDEQVTCYTDYVERLHFAAAWFNKHATWHGLWASADDAARFDNFIILPRGTGLTRIAYDDFTHANGTGLDTTTTEEGAFAWHEDGTAWDIQANRAHATLPGRAHIETEVSDAWCEDKIDLIAGAAATELFGIYLRMSAYGPAWTRNTWRFHGVAATPGNDTVLAEIDNGVVTTRATADVDYAGGNTYYFRASCEGQSINCYVDGTLVGTYNSASFNEEATWWGLYQKATNADKIYHDQFRVTEIPALGEYDAALDSF